MVKMMNETGGGASFGGEDFPANSRGVVTVPGEAVAALMEHGFKIVKDEPEKADDPELAAKLAGLADAVKLAKKELKADPENTEKKAALDAAVEALKAAKL